MPLDILCKEPEFSDGDKDLRLCPSFIANLENDDDLPARLTRDLYHHVNLLFPCDFGFKDTSIVFDTVMHQIGSEAWDTLSNLDGFNTDEFWMSIYTLLSTPKAPTRAALDHIVVI